MARRFKMQFEMVNDAFADGAAEEIARILREAAKKAAAFEDSGMIYDRNGNAVGHWMVTR